MPDAHACQGEVGSDLISWEKFKALVAKKPKAPEKQARFSARCSFAHTFSHQHVFIMFSIDSIGRSFVVTEAMID